MTSFSFENAGQGSACILRFAQRRRWERSEKCPAYGDRQRLIRAVHSGIHLTNREKEVLNLIIAGHENDAISEALAMSRDTLKPHLKHIFDKLQVKNRTQAAVKALEKGILPARKG